MTIRLHGLSISRDKLNYDNFTTRVAMTTKLGRMVVHLDGLLSIKYRDSLITSFVIAHDKLKPLCLYYHCTYGQHFCFNGDLHWGAPNQKVIQCFVHMVLQDHVKNQNHYISTTRAFLANKLGRMIWSHLTLWWGGLVRSRDKLKALYL